MAVCSLLESQQSSTICFLWGEQKRLSVTKCCVLAHLQPVFVHAYSCRVDKTGETPGLGPCAHLSYCHVYRQHSELPQTNVHSLWRNTVKEAATFHLSADIQSLQVSLWWTDKGKVSKKILTFWGAAKEKQDRDMILPIYWGDLIEVHHVFARGAEGGKFRITITLNIKRVLSDLEFMGTSKNKNKMTPNLNQLIETCKCKSK